MSDLVDIVIEDDRWSDIDIETLAAQACEAVLAELGYDAGAYEIAILACDDARITMLNADFRAAERATNVLSWPSLAREPDASGSPPPLTAPDGRAEPEFLGDIAISIDTCATEALGQHKPLDNHVTHLLVHGSLHLLGYDHGLERQAVVMEGLETAILAKLGIANPY